MTNTKNLPEGYLPSLFAQLGAASTQSSRKAQDAWAELNKLSTQPAPQRPQVRGIRQ